VIYDLDYQPYKSVRKPRVVILATPRQRMAIFRMRVDLGLDVRGIKELTKVAASKEIRALIKLSKARMLGDYRPRWYRR